MAEMVASTNTIAVDSMVSLRVGHTTRLVSCLTSRVNLAGFNGYSLQFLLKKEMLSEITAK